ncbi:MAG: hypothetical protein V4857_12455 [Pseudomonadota bacterium]
MSSRFRKVCARAAGAALLLLGTGARAAEPLRLVVPDIEPSARAHAEYFPQVLELALRKTEATYGPFSIEPYPWRVSVERSVEELRSGKAINLIWTATNPKREQQLLPVRISLLRELNNYRLLLIRGADQPRFDKIASADELRKLSAGLGSHWADTDIMRRNGYNVTTSLHYNALFQMLTLKRFDYFPRGVYEVWNEEELHRAAGLRIEKNIMLYYPAPFYFFLNKNDTAVAERIELGLKMAQEDGSFDRLLLSFPGYRRGLEEQKNGKRKLFVLEGVPALP